MYLSFCFLIGKKCNNVVKEKYMTSDHYFSILSFDLPSAFPDLKSRLTTRECAHAFFQLAA